MSRIKLINKLGITAGAVFVVSILALISLEPYLKGRNEMHDEKLKKYISGLTEKYQSYLREKASEIDSLPVDSKIIGDIKSKILHESPNIKLYLWMADNNGEFVFGNPEEAFERMNKEYDKYRDNIENDGHFLNRNEYLSNLIAHQNKIDFSEFELKQIVEKYKQRYKWRFYREGANIYGYRYPYRFLLSNSVTDATGKVIGELYLKIDDSKNHRFYQYNAANYELSGTLNSMFGIIAFFSGMFLWFLLPAWVYTDARQRDAKNPGLWAFLSLISIIFGWTLYLIARPSTYKSLHCPECQNELDGTKAFCPYCGFDLTHTFCPQCQYPVDQSWKFCPNCRAELVEEAKKENIPVGKEEN